MYWYVLDDGLFRWQVKMHINGFEKSFNGEKIKHS